MHGKKSRRKPAGFSGKRLLKKEAGSFLLIIILVNKLLIEGLFLCCSQAALMGALAVPLPPCPASVDVAAV